MDRITQLRVRNVRAIEMLSLDLSPLTVLIGENGSGKSTLLECLELLRKAGEVNFLDRFYELHRGMPGLLRAGATELTLGVEIADHADPSDRLTYEFTLATQSGWARVAREELCVEAPSTPAAARTILRRDGATAELRQGTDGALAAVSPGEHNPERLLLSSYGTRVPHPAIERMLRALGGIEVHLGFDTIAAWAARSYQFSMSLRGTTQLRPADRLQLLGFNLANAWAALKNRSSEHWAETLALVRLGLGEGFDTVHVVPDPGGGQVSLSVSRSTRPEPIAAANLSDGQLSWLAFVAMVRLDAGRTLLAVDEPELHLHPALLGRVVALLASGDTPATVVLSTHSDRVLELLETPAECVRVCTLDDEGRAAVVRLDPSELARWLPEFGDLGRIRASGYLHRVLADGDAKAPERSA